MNTKIIITSPHPQFTALALATSKELELDFEVIIVETVLEDASQKVKDICLENDIAVVVSRGGTAFAIGEAVSIPVITVEANDFDILSALWEARKYSNKIAYLCFDFTSPPYEFDNLIDIIGVEVKQIYFKTRDDMIREINRAKEQGVQVIVSGSSLAMELSEREGLRGVMVCSGKRTMVNALQRAQWVVGVRNNDRRNNRQLETVIHLSNDGIIAIDQGGLVKVTNRMAKKMLGLEEADLTDKQITDFIREPDLLKMIEDRKEVNGAVVKINETHIIVNCVPVYGNGDFYGMVITFQEVSKLEQLERNVRRQMHTRGLTTHYCFDDICSHSEIMKQCIQRAKKYACTDSTVLITGETGTGKEMFSQSIHDYSSRRNNPFVGVNCAALPESLLESELFGYEEGSFTGAKKGGKPGVFELAHKGTLFLDELGSIPMKVQVQLLRVLQEKQIIRIGGDKMIPIDVRIIAATNEELQEKVNAGAFRYDLFYRLNVLNIGLPPLRERKEDLPELIRLLIKRFNFRFKKNVSGITPGLMERLLSYPWPGNIRELMNFLERMVILATTETIGLEHLQQYGIDLSCGDLGKTTFQDKNVKAGELLEVAPGTLEAMENQILSWYDHKYGGNKTRIADELGICRTTLWKRMKQM